MASVIVHPPLLWVAGTLWPPVTGAIVAARFATRRAQRTSIGVDDWLTIPALILNFGMSATILAGVAQHSLGYPAPPFPPNANPLTAISFKETVVRKIFLAMTLLSTMALMFTKLSCMLFYRRIFKAGSNRIVGIIIYIVSILITIWGIGFFFSFLFGCGKNIHFWWGSVEDEGLCIIDITAVNYGLVISNFLLDVILLIFPIPLILRLQISRRNKIAIIGIFTLGSVTIAASITRMVIVIQELDVEFAISNHLDEDFVSAAAIYFEYLESYFALTVVCLPSLSGAMKLKGVQTMIAGFSTALSSISASLSPVRSRTSSNKSNTKHARLDSQQSRPSSASVTVPHTTEDVEMYPLS